MNVFADVKCIYSDNLYLNKLFNYPNFFKIYYVILFVKFGKMNNLFKHKLFESSEYKFTAIQFKRISYNNSL